jgi:multiple sugar transport system permease protein
MANSLPIERGQPRVGLLKRLLESEEITAYVLLIPTLIGILVFSLGAVVAALVVSFTRWDLITPPQWVGLANYQAMFSLDPLAHTALWNTLYYTVGTVPPSVFLSLLLAVAMNQKIRGIVLYRTAYFLPVISSTVAVALLWDWIYAPDYGLLNFVLHWLHLPTSQWLGDPSSAMPAIIIMSVWRGLGFNMVIFLAGLQGIPQELYEAARIDGANNWRTFRHITVPLISPVLFFVTVLAIIGSFQVFDQTYVMTQGGPLHATTTIVYYIFEEAFQWFHMGYAAALGYVLFAIILLFTLLQFNLQRLWVHYE